LIMTAGRRLGFYAVCMPAVATHVYQRAVVLPGH
jgi:hypothetical protein